MKYAIQCKDGLFAGYYFYQGDEYISVEQKGYVNPKLYTSRKRAENALVKVKQVHQGVHSFTRFEPHIIEVEDNKQ